MSLLVVAPGLLESAAADIKSIGSALDAAHAAAAVPTTGLAAAGADEVSATVAALFGGFGQEFQALNAQASAFQQQFVLTLSSGAGSYLAAEAASTSPLQPLQTVFDDVLGVINAPTELLLGRPLLGNGVNGTAASPNGQAGGLLIGNGGNGYSQTATGVAGGAGGAAGLIGFGGTGGTGGAGANGGAGGHAGWLIGVGGTGGQGGALSGTQGGIGGAGGTAGLFGLGGNGGNGGPNNNGGAGGLGGWALGPSGSAGAGAATNTSIPLTMVNTTEPVVNISVNGGKSVPVLVDTGSTGLVLPLSDVGLQHLGIPTGIGFGGYSGGLDYFYVTTSVPVNFGNGAVTAPTSVNLEIFAFPTSINAALTNGLTWQSYFAPDGVSGVWGIGPNSGGPGPSIPNTALPGAQSQGVLINEQGGYLQFGPPPTGATEIGSISGSPIGNIEVQIGNGGALQTVSATVDSGGVYGTLPSSVIGAGLPAGTVVNYYAPNNTTTPIATYTVGAGNGPEPISSGVSNTGYWPYAQHPVYISYGVAGGETIVYSSI